MRLDLGRLITEQENPSTRDIDLLPTADILMKLNEQDAAVATAVKKVIPEIAVLVDELVRRMEQGGRLLYAGCGTSARIAFMDASECPPTFGVSPDLVQVAMAGGKEAVFVAQEGTEDGVSAGKQAVDDWGAGEHDTVIGIAASGRTPYVLAALKRAKERGAFTAIVASNPVEGSPADVIISCITGPEALTGSTRLKAGTAAKMILNMISTTTMMKLGRVYGNRMCYIKSTNNKLASRSVETICKCTGLSDDEAARLLTISGGSVAKALIMAVTGAGIEEVSSALDRANGNVRKAVNLIYGK